MDDYQRLEVQFANWMDLDPAGMVACSSGSAALLLALQGLDLYGRSVVLMPDYTMVACARAAISASVIPVFLDSTPHALTLDPDDVEGAIHTIGGKAVMPVHVYGRRCNMDRIGRLARKHKLAVVEDLAEAHGVPVHKSTDAACWSFYKNKIIAGEEGGAVWFRNPDCADKARCLRSLGFTAAHDYTHVPYGWNSRMSNAHARLVLDSLQTVDRNVAQRWAQWHVFQDQVAEHFQGPLPDAPWVFDVQVGGMTLERRAEAVKILQKAGVPARYGFRPMLAQPEFQDATIPPTDNPVSYRSWAEVLYVNLVPGTPLPEVERWAQLLAKVCCYSAG